MLVPEVILYNTLNDFIQLMYDDYNDNIADPTKSLLYSLFNTDDNGFPLQYETYNWFSQAKAMFLRNDDNIRELKVGIGYNLERLNIPTVHILMPSDSKGAIDSIGKDEKRYYNTETQILTIKKEQSFRPVFHLMITSDNNSEVLLIYYFIRSIFLLFHENFDLMGIVNMQFTGQDINIDQSLTPPHIFHRNISLQFDYISKAKLNIPQPLISKLNAIFCPNLQQDINEARNKPTANIHTGFYYGDGLGMYNLDY